MISQGDALLLFDLSIDDFAWELAERDHLGDSFVMNEVVHEKCLAPQVFKEVVLRENFIIHKEEIKINTLTLSKYGLCFGSVGVIQVIKPHKMHIPVPLEEAPRQIFHALSLFFRYLIV